MTKNKKYGKTALLVASFLWGIGFVAVQGALDSGWHPYLLLGFRGLMGGAFLGLFYAFLTRYFNSNTVSYSSKVIGMAIIFPLVIWESNFSLIFGNLILVSFFLIILFKLILSFIKR